MNSPEHLPSETHKPITGYLWGALAVLTCPCHLPILAIVLAGTTAGAFIGEHWGIAALTLTGWHCCKVSDEAAFCLIQRPYISKTLLTRRISPRGSP
nr:broad-spectrum mercury transporter MerE [Klebsiella pneumoniae]